MLGASGNFYARPIVSGRTVLVDILVLAADVVLDIAVLGIFVSRPRCWVLSLNAIGIILNLLNMLVEGISFNIPTAALECVQRNEYAPMFLRIVLSQAMYEAGAASMVQCFALVQAEGLSWPQSITLFASTLLSLRSLTMGRMICGVDMGTPEAPFSLRALTLMAGYRTAFYMRLAEITFRITSMAVLMTAIHPSVAATLLVDISIVASGYYVESGDLNDTICFTITGAPLLLLSWQGGALFGRHKLDGRVWYAVTMGRVATLFAYILLTGRRQLAARFPVERLLAADASLAGDPLAVCRLLVLALCSLSGLALCCLVCYLGRAGTKLSSRDREAERQHVALTAGLTAQFQAQHAERYWSAAELGALTQTRT